MGLFGREKKDSGGTDRSEKGNKKNLTLEKEKDQEEIHSLKKEIQELTTWLVSYTSELENAKTEINTVTKELERLLEEVEFTRNEISSLRMRGRKCWRRLILQEMKSVHYD